MVETPRDRTLILPDGRRLGWCEYGDPHGEPLFAFHGTPGARPMIRVIDAEARNHGVRIIAPDRPDWEVGSDAYRPGIEVADELAAKRVAIHQDLEAMRLHAAQPTDVSV